MGRKSLYTPELVSKIIQEIKKTGSSACAIEVAGISHDTFYAWIKKKPEFSEKVKLAKMAYSRYLPDTLHEKAREKMVDVLENGYINRTTTKTIIQDAQGKEPDL